MEPHVKRYEDAASAAQNAMQAGSSERGNKLRTKTRKDREAAAQDMSGHADDLGRHVGEFIEKRKGEPPREHVGRLAEFHGSHSWGAGRYTDGSDRFNFWHHHNAANHADSLNKSLQHHYPQWKSKTQDWVQGSRVFREGAVQFHSGEEWGKPHQPAEQK